MRWFLLLSFFFVLAQSVSAADLRLRAIFPNPVGSDGGEWIAVENISQASIAAQLYSVRDVFGSTKTHTLESFYPLELKTIFASQSGITLNNTEEAVELLYQGQVIESSPTFIASQEGKVFVQLDSGWREISEAEYLERKDGRRWNASASVSGSGSEIKNPGVVQLPENTKRDDEAGEFSPNVSEILVQRAFPKLSRQTSLPMTLSGPPEWPLPPEPDYDQEMAVFLQWKREALLGSFGLFFGGVCLLLLVLPPVADIWRWLRNELLL